MSSRHGFISAFAAELDAYLTFKQSMGFTGASRVWYLRRFDSYCGAHDLTVRQASAFGTPRAINRTNSSRFSTCGAGPGDRCAIACSILLRRCDVR